MSRSLRPPRRSPHLPPKAAPATTRGRFSNRLLLLLALSACAPAAGDGAPDVLLLTLDTTRYDALGCTRSSGDPRDARVSTPHLDRLAAEGILFDAAYTAAPLTLPAHTSLLTGLYPLRHGLRDNGMGALPEAAETLAERARDRGYATAAFVGAVVLDASFGLDQGFERYDGPAERTKPARGEAERSAREVVDAALAWLGERDRERPFFLWLHFYDPHSPYEPPDDLRGKGATDLRGAYLAEVTSVDRQIGRVIDALTAEGVFERTLVLAVGDHGEAFGEHGERGHSVHCYETTLRIPLVLRLPPALAGARSGVRSTEIVSVVDVLPTLVDVLGLEAGGMELDGHDLLAVPPDRGVYFESYYGFLSFGWSPVAGWLDARGKYIHSSEPELYDLADDPAETVNRAAERADDLRRYRTAIARLAERDALGADEVDDELLDPLRGLGYAAVSVASTPLPHPLAPMDPADRPAPARMTALYDESLRAVELAEQGRVEEAADILARVLEQNRRNPFALEQLATCQVHLGRVEEAAATLRRLIEVAPGTTPGIWYKLGACLHAAGSLDEAIEALERAVQMAPERPRFLAELAGALRQAGRVEEARAVEARLAALPRGE